MSLAATEHFYPARREVLPHCLEAVTLTGDITYRDGDPLTDLPELTGLYMTVFNMNNMHVLQRYALSALTDGIGQPFWDEAPWSPELALGTLLAYMKSGNVTTVAMAPTDKGLRVIAFNAIENRTERFTTTDDYLKRYPGLDRQDGDQFFHIADTFRMPFLTTAEGQEVKGLGRTMRQQSIDKVLAQADRSRRVILSASTANPAVIHIWETSGWTVVPNTVQEWRGPYPFMGGYTVIEPKKKNRRKS